MRHFIFILLIFFLKLSLRAQASIAMLGADYDLEKIAGISNEVLSTNFELHQGKIIFEASINGKKGNFLLDTGAEALIINGIPAEKEDFQLQGLTENSHAQPILVERLTWENQTFESIAGYRVNLQELENSIGLELAGIIGHSILGQGAIYIDYRNQLITFFPSPKSRQLKKEGWKAHHLFKVQHLLAIGLKINGKKHYMGLDTGAEINLVAEPSNISVCPDKFIQVFGISGKTSHAAQVALESVQINKSLVDVGDLYYTPLASFSDQFDGQLSGLLGFPFFANNAFILDLANQVLYLKN